MPEQPGQKIPSDNKLLRAALDETASTLVAAVNNYIELMNNIDDKGESEDYSVFSEQAAIVGLTTAQINVAALGLASEFREEFDQSLWLPESIFPILGLVASSCFLIKEAGSFQALKETPLSSPKLIVEMLDRPEIEEWLTACFSQS